MLEFRYDNVADPNSDDDYAKQQKELMDSFDISPEDSRYLLSFKDVLDTISRFYNKNGDPVTVNFKEADTAYCTEKNQIIIPPKMVLQFYMNNLPKFCVYYHELGHALYSEDAFHLIEKWKNISNAFTSAMYDKKYLYLLNWIEDYYIENRMVKTYPYLTDILACLKKLPHQYDATKREFAFHYYYETKQISPSFNLQEGTVFNKFILDLLALRASSTFGKGPLALLNKNNVNMKFIDTLKRFHAWCVQMQIFPDVALPPLSLPSNVIVNSTPNGNTNANGVPGSGGTGNDPYGTGAYSGHNNSVPTTPVQQFPKLDPNLQLDPILIKQFKAEKQYMTRTLNSYRYDIQKNSLYGVFTTDMEQSNMIGKPIIPNFFNTNRLEDRILFQQPGRTFTNVSIYRDISGSTTGYFDLIDKVCNYLDKNIPIDKHFYLYSSGDISIMETEYKEWGEESDTPELYANDPIYKQMGGGTNSDAIADVMAEQMNDKWLNIIVTDGDLYALFNRDNIEALLHNIAVIEVNTSTDKDSTCHESMGAFGDHYVHINNENDIPNINDMLYNIKEDTM